MLEALVAMLVANKAVLHENLAIPSATDTFCNAVKAALLATMDIGEIAAAKFDVHAAVEVAVSNAMIVLDNVFDDHVLVLDAQTLRLDPHAAALDANDALVTVGASVARVTARRLLVFTEVLLPNTASALVAATVLVSEAAWATNAATWLQLKTTALLENAPALLAQVDMGCS